jgi:hypothetical protein
MNFESLPGSSSPILISANSLIDNEAARMVKMMTIQNRNRFIYFPYLSSKLLITPSYITRIISRIELVAIPALHIFFCSSLYSYIFRVLTLNIHSQAMFQVFRFLDCTFLRHLNYLLKDSFISHVPYWTMKFPYQLL